MKTKNNAPVEDTAAGDVLAQFTMLRDALGATHSEIPALLARERTISHDLGLSEARGDAGADDLRRQLVDIVHQRQAAVRRRASSVDALLEMEPALETERGIAEQERQRIAGEIVREFSARWREACDRLAALRAEAEVLARALRCTIQTPAPYQAYMHPVRETPELRPLAASGPPPTVALPGHLSILINRLDALDSALSRVQAIKQSKQLDARHYDLAKVRGTPAEFSGVFEVTGEFDSLVDGMKFAVGTLVDSTLIGAGQLARLTLARRYLRPADLAATAA
jgi:hypothetical protein